MVNCRATRFYIIFQLHHRKILYHIYTYLFEYIYIYVCTLQKLNLKKTKKIQKKKKKEKYKSVLLFLKIIPMYATIILFRNIKVKMTKENEKNLKH